MNKNTNGESLATAVFVLQTVSAAVAMTTEISKSRRHGWLSLSASQSVLLRHSQLSFKSQLSRRRIFGVTTIDSAQPCHCLDPTIFSPPYRL